VATVPRPRLLASFALALCTIAAAFLAPTSATGADRAPGAPGVPGPPAAAPPPSTPVDKQNVAWLSHVETPSPVAGDFGAGIAGLAFMRYPGGPDRDVMFADGPFGVAAWSLADPAHPRLLSVINAAGLAQPGDDAAKGFWEGEHLQVDQARKLVFVSRDPRAYGGTLQTGQLGIYIVDARNPRRLRLTTFHPTPAGHTSGCIDGCKYLWTGGPFRRIPPEFNGQPVWVTDMRNAARPVTLPTPVDLNRDDGTTAYVHSTDVDAAGIAWVSGLGGVRGYWTSGRHFDPVAGRVRTATPADPVPYAGGKIISPNNPDYTFDHNAWRPLKKFRGFRAGELLFVTDENFGATCEDAGRLLVVSLAGSFHGEGWRSTPDHPFRLKVVGEWGPVGKPGMQPGIDCSAHYFDDMPGVGNGKILVEAFYLQGTRFLDVSDPANPRQVGYFVPQGSEAAVPAFHDGLVYAAQYSGGIDVLRFAPPTS
jgi:hypothetical protein